MTQRERSMFLAAAAVGGFLLLFGGFVGVRSLFAALDDKDQEILTLQGTVSSNQAKLLGLSKARTTLHEHRAISLPPDPEIAKSVYRTFLRDLCRGNGLHIQKIVDSGYQRTLSVGQNARSYVPLTYEVHADGTLAQWLRFLDKFYTINLLHQIRELTLTSEGDKPSGRLTITFKVEALSLPDAPAHKSLLPPPDLRVFVLDVAAALLRQGPAGLASGLWLLTPGGIHGSHKLAAAVGASRDYPRLANRNVFVGLKPQPPPGALARQTLASVQLTSITSNSIRAEAWLRNGITNRRILVRQGSPFNDLVVRDATGHVVLRGKVKAINDRSLDFAVGPKEYHLVLGQKLAEVLHSDRLSLPELEALAGPPRAEQSADRRGWRRR